MTATWLKISRTPNYNPAITSERLLNLEYSLGGMAFEDAVELAKLGSTIIEGGYLKTGLVDAGRIDTGVLNANLVKIEAKDPATGQGIEVWDGATRKVLIGRLDDGTIGQEIRGGKIYSTEIRSGEPGATSYVQIDAGDSPVRVVENGKTALELWTSSKFGLQGSGGAVEFRDVTADDVRGFIGAFNSTMGGTYVYDGIIINAEDYATNEKDIVLHGDNIRIAAESSILMQPALAASADVYMDGNVTITGDLVVNGSYPKSSVEYTTHGVRRLAAVESPGVKYTDGNKAQLIEGECKIQLDQIFIECIEPDTEKTPWLFKLTPMADMELFVAEVGNDYFVVKARGGEKVSGPFCWFIEATRRHFADWRFKEIPIEKISGNSCPIPRY